MIVVALALAAAALAAISAAGEQRAASRLAAGRPGRGRRLWGIPAFALALLSTPLWLFSWLLDSVSWLVQAAALHLGSLSVVQPVMVSTLAFSVPLAAWGTGRMPDLRDWTGIAAVSGGLVLVLTSRPPVPDDAATQEAALLPAMGGLLVVVAALVAVSSGRSAPLRAGLLSVAAGCLFGVAAAATKLAAGVATTTGFLGLLTTWPGYVLAAASVGSFGLQQAAYASGPLAPAMTAVVITDPLASYLLGVVGFGEPLPAPGWPLALSVAGMVVLAAGVAVLARSPLLQHPEPIPAGPGPLDRPGGG